MLTLHFWIIFSYTLPTHIFLTMAPPPPLCFFFFLNDPPPPEIYPLPQHAALRICLGDASRVRPRAEGPPGFAQLLCPHHPADAEGLQKHHERRQARQTPPQTRRPAG